MELKLNKMKVKIMQRTVYHKYAEIEIEVDENDFQHYLKCNTPKGANALDYLSDYLVDNENLYVDKIDYKISHARYKFGFGLREGMCEKDNPSEWRYEVTDQNYGGHL